MYGAIFAPDLRGELYNGGVAALMAAPNPFSIRDNNWDPTAGGAEFARRFELAQLG